MEWLECPALTDGHGSLTKLFGVGESSSMTVVVVARGGGEDGEAKIVSMGRLCVSLFARRNT